MAGQGEVYIKMENDLQLFQVENDRLVFCFQIWQNKLYKRTFDTILNKELECVMIKDFSVQVEEQQYTLPKFEVE